MTLQLVEQQNQMIRYMRYTSMSDWEAGGGYSIDGMHISQQTFDRIVRQGEYERIDAPSVTFAWITSSYGNGVYADYGSAEKGYLSAVKSQFSGGSRTEITSGPMQDPIFNPPTAKDGGFVNNQKDFMNFMTTAAANIGVEVAAFGLKNGKYFIQPWEGNTAIRSENDFSLVSGLEVIGQYHTHPNSTAGPSYRDAQFSQKYNIPVTTFGENGSMWRVDYSTPPGNYPYIIPRYPDWMSYGVRIK